MNWITKHKITGKTAGLVGRLRDLAREIDDGLLDAASSDARGEWTLLRETWPTSADVGMGVVALSDEELDLMIGKVLRFRSILHRLRGRRERQLALVPAAA